MDQKDLAKQAIEEWLTYELKGKPYRLEMTNDFEYDGMRYYIFKFQKNFFQRNWLLAVCGGYEKESNEHCGHVFSQFKEYKKEIEQPEAILIIEYIKDYWKTRAKEFGEN